MVAFQFLGELILEFVSGFFNIFVSSQTELGGIFGGLFRIINVVGYINILNSYKASFGVGDWIVAILGMVLFLALIVGLIWVCAHFLSKLFRRYFSKKPINEDFCLP